jgi:hypothetical protein
MKCPICQSNFVTVTHTGVNSCLTCKYEWRRVESDEIELNEWRRMGEVIATCGVQALLFADFNNVRVSRCAGNILDAQAPKPEPVVTGVDMGGTDGDMSMEATIADGNIVDVVCRGAWQMNNNCKRCKRCLPWKSVAHNAHYRNLDEAAARDVYQVEWDSPDPVPYPYAAKMRYGCVDHEAFERNMPTWHAVR